MSYDVVVVGAGVVGLAAAWALARRGRSVVVIDKEAHLGAHASGRNSGVLHAGFYYSASSLKARFSVEGNRRWKELCARLEVPVARVGKLVVAQGAHDVPTLQALLARGRANGVELELISAADARRREPRVRTHEAALWSPTTATLDPRRALRALARQAVADGVELHLGRRATGVGRGFVKIGHDRLRGSVMLNAAGLFADRVAAWCGVGEGLRIAPFRGLYLHASRRAPPLQTCVYPVPEPEMPFLGVHFTPTASGGHHIGPTAMPAWWREQYGGVAGLSEGEALGVSARHVRLVLGEPRFRALAKRELGKLSRRWLVRRAVPLLDDVDWRHYRRWGRPGIRAQLLDVDRGELVSDFVVQHTERSVHVLNAVSPAFTCALPFGEHLADDVEERL